MAKTFEELEAEYNYWGEHPKYPSDDWKLDVANGDTRLGYWQWVVSMMEAQEENED